MQEEKSSRRNFFLAAQMREKASCAARKSPPTLRAMFTLHDLIARVDAHLAASGESPAAFGRRVANDSNLVADLRAGRQPRMCLAARIWDAAAKGSPSRSPRRVSERA
jgi:hypothetical protein